MECWLCDSTQTMVAINGGVDFHLHTCWAHINDTVEYLQVAALKRATAPFN